MSRHDQTQLGKVDLIKGHDWFLHRDLVDLLVSWMVIHVLVMGAL